MENQTPSFDTVLCRRGTGSMKWDVQGNVRGREGLLSFGMADMDFAVAPEITEALRRRIEHPVFGYTAAGPELKQAIARWFEARHGWKPEPEWMLLGSGVVTAISLALEALTDIGDKIVVLTPVYDQFFTILKGLRRDIICCDLLPDADGGYTADEAALEKALAQGAKAVLFCNPHNPVGKVWGRRELQRIVALCRARGAYLLSDEIHADILMPGHVYTPMLDVEGADACAVSFLSPSKTFNISGLSLSVAVARDETLLKRLGEQFHAHFIMGSNLFAYTAAGAAYQYGGPWLDGLLRYLAGNAAYVRESLSGGLSRVRVGRLEGTFLMWLDLRGYGLASQELCRRLSERYGVVVGNGGSYGMAGEGFIRLNIGCPRETLRRGAEAIGRMCGDLERG